MIGKLKACNGFGGLVLALIAAALLPSAAVAQTCNVSPEKRSLITAVLCGQNASVAEYRAEGATCVARAFRNRSLDTAKQVAVFRACGDAAFAERLRAGTLQSMKFVQALSACAGERVDFDALYAAAEREVASRATMLVCTAELSGAIVAQRAQIDRGLETALDPASAQAIADRFAIKLDDEGNVVER